MPANGIRQYLSKNNDVAPTYHCAVSFPNKDIFPISPLYSLKIFFRLSLNECALATLLNDLFPTTPNSESSRFDDLSTLPRSSYIVCVSRGEWENEKMLNACGAVGAVVGKRANDWAETEYDISSVSCKAGGLQ